MLKNFVRNYYKLLDEKIENGTFMVLIIALLITSVGNTVNDPNNTQLLSLKTNIIETDSSINNTIIVDGKTYKLID